MNSVVGKLIILSVPFQRINRVLLSPPVLKAIERDDKIAIVSPFANHPEFQSEYLDDRVIFLETPSINRKIRLVSILYEVSEILRMYGHWRKYKNSGTRYHNLIRKYKLGIDGADKKYTGFLRYYFSLFSWLGKIKILWKVIDNLLGKRIYNFPDLVNLCKKYENVVLIQSASWGEQDRMLAWHARKLHWKSIMIPYTTDQLYCNGYLLLDYDYICVQGPKEESFAKQYHSVNESKLIRLGNTWFRHIEELTQKINIRDRHEKVICYAGCSNVYFPSESEFFALDFLINAIKRAELENVSIMYRPLVESEEEGNIIRERYENVPFLTIQFAQKACYSLEDVGTTSQKEQLVEYLEQVSHVDLLIMSYATTLSIDLAFLGIPTISNFVDHTGTLAKRNTHLRLNSESRIEGIESIPVIEDMGNMIPTIKDLLYNKVSAKGQSEFTKNQWDFAQTDFDSTLKAILK